LLHKHFHRIFVARLELVTVFQHFYLFHNFWHNL
jgi:hypothetical protein